MTDTVQTLRHQLVQLQARHRSGKLSARAYAAAKVPLEQRLVQAVLAEPGHGTAEAAAAAAAPRTRPSGRLLAGLIAGVLVLAVAGYAWTGTPQALDPAARAPDHAAAADAAQSNGDADLGAAVERLAKKLQDKPDNPEGWAMLARSYTRLGRYAEAVPAFERAVAQTPDDATLLIDYADTLAVRNNRNLQGEPGKLIARALALDPDQPKALALSGTAAFERKDYAAAVTAWEHLARLSTADSAFMPQLLGSIREARELAGMPAAGPGPGSAEAKPAATATATVQGRVSLAPALAGRAAPEDTVFIFARAANGPRMPLAILRCQVKDLPLSFSLDDSSAMAPAMRLSLHPQVVIAARISKSGQATPAPGDLIGQSGPVANNARGLALEINEVVKP